MFQNANGTIRRYGFFGTETVAVTIATSISMPRNKFIRTDVAPLYIPAFRRINRSGASYGTPRKTMVWCVERMARKTVARKFPLQKARGSYSLMGYSAWVVQTGTHHEAGIMHVERGRQGLWRL